VKKKKKGGARSATTTDKGREERPFGGDRGKMEPVREGIGGRGIYLTLRGKQGKGRGLGGLEERKGDFYSKQKKQLKLVSVRRLVSEKRPIRRRESVLTSAENREKI